MIGLTGRNLVVATSNQGKMQELRKILPKSFNILGLEDIGCTHEIPETGATFAENALLKARFIYEKYQVDCVADDSGLEVDALEGRPGVHSARYAGPACSSSDNISKLLKEMHGATRRGARFKTVLVLILNGKEHQFEGVVEGKISDLPSGTGGFGYDPVFVADGHSITFAEMAADEKNRISHRGMAVSKLKTFLDLHPEG